MNRRDALLIAATAGVGGWIAQKELVFGSEDENGGDEDSSGGTSDSQTVDSDSDETSSDEEDSSRSAYEIGEPFEISSVGYTVDGLYRAEKLGSEMNPVEPEGLFVVSQVTLKNNRSETIEFPATNLRIRSENNWSYAKEEASQAAEDDDRIELDSWENNAIAADGQRTGIAVFDVDPETNYELWFLSVTDSDQPQATVSVGEPVDLDTLQGVLTG